MNLKSDISGQRLPEEHRVLVNDRKSVSLTGVLDVVSFDEMGAVLKTNLGTLAIDGEGIHVVKLDLSNGVVDIEGKLNGFFYSDVVGAKAKKRLFR